MTYDSLSGKLLLCNCEKYLNYLCQNKTFLIVTEEFLKKALYEVLYNNLLLLRTHARKDRKIGTAI